MGRTSKYAATRITSRKNISSSPGTLTRAEIRSLRKIICNTPSITSDLLRRPKRRRRSHRVVSSGRPERAKATTWKTMAISARCRIVSPRQRSGRTFTSSRNKDFNHNRTPRRTPHNRSARDRHTMPSARAAPIAGDLRPGRSVKATDFRIAVRDPIDNSLSETRVIATIGKGAMVVRGISGPTEILSRREKPAPRRQRRLGFPPSLRRARGRITRIRPRARRPPRRQHRRRLSRLPTLPPPSSNRRQREAPFQPEADAGGCGRHMDLAEPVQVKQRGQTLPRSPTTRPLGSSCRRRKRM